MTSSSRRAGVTLIELILVMSLLLILSSVVAPRFSTFFPGLQVGESARHLLAWAKKARSEAALTGARQRLYLDGREFWLEAETSPLKEPGKFKAVGGSWKRERLPEDVQVQLQGFKDKYLEFAPDGTTRDASITLSNEQGDVQTIRIVGATSRVTIETEPAP